MLYNLKKHAANIVTLIRIAASVLLLFIQPLSVIFFLLYAAAGISDMVDGVIARRFRTTSRSGAALDSIADLIFILVMLIIFLPLISLEIWMLVWLGVIAVLRISSIAAGLFRYRALAFLHTYTNKATGLLMFCFPVFYKYAGIEATVIMICSLAVLSAAEELYINLTAAHLNRDIRSLFHKQ